LWQHSSHSPEQPSLQLLAELDAVPSLVLELARSQLRSLQEGVSRDSLVLEEVGEPPVAFDVVVDGKPLRIPISALPSPSPTPSQRKLPRTSSSSESDQARDPNGTFSAPEEVTE